MVAPRKSLGQNFLKDKLLLAYEIAQARVSKSDTVLEIGTGPGTLTRMLAAAAGKVYTIEKDRRFEQELADLPENVEIIWGDALKVQWPKFNKIVANIPYNISSKLTFKLLKENFELGVLTYQKEFAERMTAQPGSQNYGRLPAAVSFLAEIKILRTVKAGSFFPKPKVDSAMVLIKPLPRPEAWEELEQLINRIFQQPRKKLRNSLDTVAPADLVDKRVRELTRSDIERIYRHRNL